MECLRSADHVSSAGPGELRRDDHHRHEAQRRPHDCPSNGIVIGAGDITLDLNGHTVCGEGVPTTTRRLILTFPGRVGTADAADRTPAAATRQ